MSDGDLTARTHIRVSLAQAIVIASVVASGAIAWYSEKSQREQHERNIDVHLDATFTREHGVPVGKWDMVNRDTAATDGFKALQGQVDQMKKTQAAFESELDRRRPKWHP